MQKLPAMELLAVMVDGGKHALAKIVRATAEFVIKYSDNGRVGQAFVASVLDVVYGPSRVVLGNTADPDASVPGDVQVEDDTGIWLWTEVKQKSVTTGDVEQFVGKVREVGGERILYCALGNERYPHNIDRIRNYASNTEVLVNYVYENVESTDVYRCIS